MLFFIILTITVLASYKGFQDYSFIEQYKFSTQGLARKEYFRLLSAGFLHANWEHLIFNMLSLFFFSGIAQEFFGKGGFVLLYFGAVATGNLLSYYLYKKQAYYSAIGASGGVSGVIFAAIALAPSAIKVNFLPGWLFGLLYFSYSVYMMFHSSRQDNIGHSAHIGGALFGFGMSGILFPEYLIHNLNYLLIMAAPLFYMAYKVNEKQ